MRLLRNFVYFLLTASFLASCGYSKSSAANQRNPTRLANEILMLLIEKNNDAQVKFAEDANKLINTYVTEFARSIICVNKKLTSVEVMEVKNYFLEFADELIRQSSSNYQITKDGIKDG